MESQVDQYISTILFLNRTYTLWKKHVYHIEYTIYSLINIIIIIIIILLSRKAQNPEPDVLNL